MNKLRLILGSAALAAGTLTVTALPAQADGLPQIGSLANLNRATQPLQPVLNLVAPITRLLPLK
ncbi:MULTISPECIES: hypothetical protein [Streptomyces]|nr:hypothetical protein [Streptomyces virginiae]